MHFVLPERHIPHRKVKEVIGIVCFLKAGYGYVRPLV